MGTRFRVSGVRSESVPITEVILESERQGRVGGYAIRDVSFGIRNNKFEITEMKGRGDI